MGEQDSSKSPLEYLSDIVEYRDESKKFQPSDIELLQSNIELVRQQLLEDGLSTSEREKITVILLGLLYHPFVSLDLRPSERPDSLIDCYLNVANLNGNSKNESNVNLLTVYTIVKMISSLQEDLFSLTDAIRDLMKTKERMFLEMDLSFRKLLYSIGVISYIGYGLEKTFPSNPHFFPNVFSSQYILIRHLPMLNLLLSRQDENIFDKGLVLGVKLFRRISRGSLDSSFLDLLPDSPIDNSLIKIMKYNYNKTARSTSLALFKLFVNSFNVPTRCQFLNRILFNPDAEKGSHRLVLLMYKDLFVSESNWNCFKLNIKQVVIQSVKLSFPNGAETDLAENFDPICTLLNFIRYLLLRDKYDLNETRIWDLIDFLKRDCIDITWQAIRLSRTQYKARLHELESPNRKVKRIEDDQVKVEILNDDNEKDKLMPSLSATMTEEKEIDSLRMGLVNMDMIGSILERLIDIISEATRSSIDNEFSKLST